ncbi:MAG TPA: CDP-diacylglycerol diphosphatase, partial [Phenylobacterium sp.]|nr:CDP-diacylglycerol diphosphatase [Phenylobacterium sp.]
MTRGFGVRLIGVLAAAVVAGCASLAPDLPPPPVRPNGQTLWHILHDQCVPGQQARGAPAPCALVTTNEGEARGYVLLKDRTGPAQFLLLPTAKITGI